MGPLKDQVLANASTSTSVIDRLVEKVSFGHVYTMSSTTSTE
jgi:hypothetical protein